MEEDYHLPKTVEIFGSEVNLDVLRDSCKGVLSDSLQSKLMLHNIMIENSDCTSFLMWFSCCCVSCIFKPKKKSKYLYSLFSL